MAGATTWSASDVSWNAATWTAATGVAGTLSNAAFNTVASLSSFPAVSIVIGVLMLIACTLVPRRLGPAPSPFPA